MPPHAYPHTDLASPRPRPARVLAPTARLGLPLALMTAGLILGLLVAALALSR